MKPTDLRPKDIQGLAKHECGLYVKMTNGWTQGHFKHECYEKGDIIYITCRKIIHDNDRSEWAYKALEQMYLLLRLRWRWPKELDDDNDAKSNIIYHLDYLRWKIWYLFNKPKPGHRLYRPRTNMTRDGFIMMITLAVFLDEWKYVKWVAIPFHLYSRTTWRWHRYLKSGSIKDLESYKKSEGNKEGGKDYVKLLQYHRRMAVLIKLGG
ncbi:hypothetical protein KAU11_09420 [Candidatus Babeliales bacterium]|nr:hypothetical protein [Candidatus Babeliales bacterium]